MKKLNEEEQMKLDFDMMPELPAEFDELVDRLCAESRRIFYKRNHNKASYHCTKCGADYTLRVGNQSIYDIYYPSYQRRIETKIPVEGEKETCKECGTVAFLKPVRRWTYDYNWKYICTWQVYENGLIERYFEIKKIDNLKRAEEVDIRELSRTFYEMNSVRKYEKRWYYYTDMYGHQYGFERVYGKRMNESEADMISGDPAELYKSTPLRYCPYEQMKTIFNKKYYTTDRNKADEQILRTYCKFPGIEMEIKFGMYNIAAHHLVRLGVDGNMNKKAKKPWDIYKVYPDRLKLLRGCSLTEWDIYREERKKGVRYTDEEIAFLRDWYGHHNQSIIQNLTKYMTLNQLINRIAKYKKEKKGYETDYSVASHYSDYLDMRLELGYDMTNSVYLYPKNLKRSHDKMVKEKQDRKDELRIKEVLLKYMEIPERFKNLNRKYAFTNHGYMIRPAKDAAEIVREGWNLHHCVGGDRYLKKHNIGETAILFMRSVDKPDKSYVTIEVQGNRILQWHGAHDKQNVTKDARACLEEFTKKISRKRRQVPQPARLRVAV